MTFRAWLATGILIVLAFVGIWYTQRPAKTQAAEQAPAPEEAAPAAPKRYVFNRILAPGETTGWIDIEDGRVFQIRYYGPIRVVWEDTAGKTHVTEIAVDTNAPLPLDIERMLVKSLDTKPARFKMWYLDADEARAVRERRR